MKNTLNYGLIAHWPLNEGAGTTVYDVSGNLKNGSFLGSPAPTWVQTERGIALKFTTGGGCVDFGNIFDFGSTDSFSMVFWSKLDAAHFTASRSTNQLTVSAIAGGQITIGMPIQTTGFLSACTVTAFGTGTGGTGTYTVSASGTVSSTTWMGGYIQFNPIIGKLNISSPFNGYEVYLNLASGTYGTFKMMDASSVAAQSGTSIAAPVGQWHMIAAVCDRTLQLAKCSLNGHTFTSNSCSTVGSLSVPTQTFQLGYQGNQYGWLSDVRIYNRPVSLAELNLLYHARKGIPGLALSYVRGGVAPSNVDYTDGVTETVTAADANTVAVTTSLTETTTATDTPTNTTISLASITETTTAADAPTNTTISVTSVTETVTAADAPTNTTVQNHVVTETATATEIGSASGIIYPVAITETAANSDTIANITTQNDTIPESATATDAPTTTVIFVGSLTESVTAAEAPTATAAHPDSLTESSTASDAPTVTVELLYSITETVTAATTETVTWLISFTEPVTATDAPAVVLARFSSISESASAVATINLVSVFLDTIHETATATVASGFTWRFTRTDSNPAHITITLYNAAGLGLPPLDTPFSIWNNATYKFANRIRYDYFTGTTLDESKWVPWLGGDLFGNVDQHARFIGRAPNSVEPGFEGGTVGYGPETGFSCWTLWKFSTDPSTGTPIPTFNAEIFDPYPAGSNINLTGEQHLVSGPGVANDDGGLKIISTHNPYFAFDFHEGFGDRFGQPVRLIEGSYEMTFRPPYIATATTTATAPPGTDILTFAGGVPAGLLYGMEITDLTHPDHSEENGYIIISGNDQYHVGTYVKSFTATTVTLTLPTGPQGVPAGDVIKFETGLIGNLLADAPYYIFADGVPSGTTITYKDAVGLDWTTVTSTGTQNWSDAANSDDGTTIVAVVNGGFVWVSEDYGFTWTQRHISRGWNGCAISGDGSVMYVCAIGDYVYRSSDMGATWTQLVFPGDLVFTGAFTQMACSADGSIVYVTVTGGGHFEIWKSIDFGANWAVTSDEPLEWYAIACSDDGQTIIVSVQLEEIHLSYDGGSTWSVADTNISFAPVPWSKVYVTSDGSHMIAVMHGGFLVTSTDHGVTWEKQFASGFPATNTNTACQSDDGREVFYGNTNAVATGGLRIYYSSNFGANYLPVDGIVEGIWVVLLCNNDFTSFVAFPENGFIYVSQGEGPTIRQQMSNPATITADPTMIARFSRHGWVSGMVTGMSIRWPATGGYLQIRSKYPDTRFGANGIITFYPVTSDEAFALSNFSLESGYNEFSDVDPRRQFLVGFFDGTSTGLITPSIEYTTENFSTWGFEYYPDIAFSIYLDNNFQWSTSRAMFQASIIGSTMTIIGEILSIGGILRDDDGLPIVNDNGVILRDDGGIEANRWVRYRESSQSLYLHHGSGNFWVVYDYNTGLPVNLNVPPTTMAVSVNKIEQISPVTGLPVRLPNPNMRGENNIGLALYADIGTHGFHTLSDFTQHPGPFEWIIEGVELFTLPGTFNLHDMIRNENAKLQELLRKASGLFALYGSDTLTAQENYIINEIRQRGHYVFSFVDEGDASDTSSHPSRAVIHASKNAYTPVPTNLQDWYPWLSSVARATNNILAGRQNIVHITVSLTPNSDTTIVKDSRIGNTSYIGLVPLTENAAAEIPWFTEQIKGQVTLHHSVSDQTDRSFRLVIQA